MSAPDWREVFARAAADYATRDSLLPIIDGNPPWDVDYATADAILAAIAERGYRLHRDHAWVDDLSDPVRIAVDWPRVPKNCSRCGVMIGGLSDRASCEGPA